MDKAATHYARGVLALLATTATAAHGANPPDPVDWTGPGGLMLLALGLLLLGGVSIVRARRNHKSRGHN